jgi:nickel-dependent lactate racemase
LEYRFPYKGVSGIEGITIPDGMDVRVYRVKSVPDVQKQGSAIVREALLHPIGLPPLGALLHPHHSVLLVVDDMSRPTPVREILGSVLDEIHRAGVPKTKVRILIALGTHRFMTRKEMEDRFGKTIAGSYEIRNHEWNNPSELHEYGVLGNGTRVVLNRAMHESDAVIGIGSIAPHPAAGFSGGGKILTPGVATDEAAGEFHWESVQYPQKAVLGVRDNPMRERIDAIARLAGLTFVVNVIMDGSNRVVDAVCGDPVEAHKAGAVRSLEIFGVQIENPRDADIFIIDTHPLDQELWQGVKALCALECIIPDHAIGIVVSPFPEGICQTHPEVLENGFQPLERVRGLIESGKVSKIVGHNLVQGGRLLAHTTCSLASPGVSGEEANRMGFSYFPTAQQALDAAMQTKGGKAKIVILGMGGEIAPRERLT